MLFHDCPKASTRDFKWLGTTSRWTSWTSFDGHSDMNQMIHTLECHKSWNKSGEVFRENITALTKIFNLLWNWSVVWKSCTKSKVEMRPEGAYHGREACIIAKKCSTANDCCCILHQWMNFPTSTVVTWISITFPVFSYKLSYFIPITPKLTEWPPF